MRARAKMITEFILAIERNLKLSDLAGPIHAYPTYSTAVSNSRPK